MTSVFKRPKLPDFRRMQRAEIRRFVDQFVGVFFAIPLDGQFSFGRVLPRGVIACYDLRAPTIVELEKIEQATVLFAVGGVIRRVMGGRIWKTLGRKPLTGAMAKPVKFFREDALTGIVDIRSEGEFHPYASEDLSCLDRMAIWNRQSVEERLFCHFARIRYGGTVHLYDPQECQSQRLKLRAALAAGAQLRNHAVRFLTLTTEESLAEMGRRAHRRSRRGKT